MTGNLLGAATAREPRLCQHLQTRSPACALRAPACTRGPCTFSPLRTNNDSPMIPKRGTPSPQAETRPPPRRQGSTPSPSPPYLVPLPLPTFPSPSLLPLVTPPPSFPLLLPCTRSSSPLHPIQPLLTWSLSPSSPDSTLLSRLPSCPLPQPRPQHRAPGWTHLIPSRWVRGSTAGLSSWGNPVAGETESSTVCATAVQECTSGCRRNREMGGVSRHQTLRRNPGADVSHVPVALHDLRNAFL